MAIVWLDPAVRTSLDALRATPGTRYVVIAVDNALDLLEADPGAAEVRAHRFVDGQWMFTFAVPRERWMVLWWARDDAGHEGEPYVTYIGPIFETPGR